MTIILLQIDKSGGDLFEKGYSLVLVKNKKHVFGVNIPIQLKKELNNCFLRGELNITSKSHKSDKLRFKIRFHTAVIIELIFESLKNEKIGELSIQICNDFDGHFHEIKNMIFDNIKVLTQKLKPEDIVMTKFQKPSFIDTAGKNIRKKRYEGYKIIKIDSQKIKKIIKR